jgi:hypothetical protein
MNYIARPQSSKTFRKGQGLECSPGNSVISVSIKRKTSEKGNGKMPIMHFVDISPPKLVKESMKVERIEKMIKVRPSFNLNISNARQSSQQENKRKPSLTSRSVNQSASKIKISLLSKMSGSYRKWTRVEIRNHELFSILRKKHRYFQEGMFICGKSCMSKDI